jgi:hypothetical protein
MWLFGVLLAAATSYACEADSGIGLNADTVIWTDSQHIRLIYTWKDAAQLDDWAAVGGATRSIVGGTLHIVGGTGNVRGVKLSRRIAATSVRAYISAHAGYNCIYTGLPASYDGTAYLATPCQGHLWGVASADAYWIKDGVSSVYSVAAIGTSKHWVHLRVTSDSMLIREDSYSWGHHLYTNTFDTASIIAVGGAFNDSSTVDSVIIDGVIAPTYICQGSTHTATGVINPAGGGTASYSPSQSVSPGDSVRVTFTAAAGYKYLGMSGCAYDTARSITFDSMITDTSITGNFVKDSAQIILIKTDNAGTSGDSSITLPVNAVSANYRAYFSDGTMKDTTATSLTHKFPQKGVYRIGIVANTGNGFSNLVFNNGGDRLKMLDLQRFGKNRCDALNRSFYGCSNMKLSARDTGVFATAGSAELCFAYTAIDTLPRMILSGISNMASFCSGCASLTYIDTIYSPATSFNYAFDHCDNLRYFKGVYTNSGTDFTGMLRSDFLLDSCKFNMNSATVMIQLCNYDSVLKKFDVTSTLHDVVYGGEAFEGCQKMTNIGPRDWSHLRESAFMFRACTTFTEFNDSTPVLRDALEMFVECRNMTNLNIVAPVCTSFYYLVHNCIDLDTISITNDSCKNYHYAFSHTNNGSHTIDSFYVSNNMKMMTNGSGAFEYNSLSSSRYSSLLDSLAALNTNHSVVFNGGSSKYLSQSKPSRDTLVAHSWTIADGGQATQAVPTYSLTVAHTGSGSTSPVSSATVDSGVATSISAAGVDSTNFVGWSVSSGTATIANRLSSSTTVTLQSNATISAKFLTKYAFVKNKIWISNTRTQRYTDAGFNAPQYKYDSSVSISVSGTPHRFSFRVGFWPNIYRDYTQSDSVPLLVTTHQTIVSSDLETILTCTDAKVADARSIEHLITLTIVVDTTGNTGGTWWWGTILGGTTPTSWVETEALAIIDSVIAHGADWLHTRASCDSLHGRIVDPNRVYIEGHSLGGTAAYRMGIKHPEIFAALNSHAGYANFWETPNHNFNGVICDTAYHCLTPGLNGTDYLARDYTDMAWFVNTHKGLSWVNRVNKKYYTPYIIMSHGKTDVTVPPASSNRLQWNADSAHAGYSYYKYAGDHGSGDTARMECMLNFRKNKSYLSFSRNTANTTGTVDWYNNLSVLGWYPDSTHDSIASYQAVLYNTSGLDTVDVGLHRLQSLSTIANSQFRVYVGGVAFDTISVTDSIPVVRDVPVGSHTVIRFELVVPTIDSIRDSTALRDSTYHQTVRPSDIANIYGSGFGTSGAASKAYANSTGTLEFTVRSWSDTKIVVTVPASTPRGWYSSWILTKDLVPSTPKYHAMQVKRPGGS